MAVYEYCCESHGIFEASYPIGAALAMAPCPVCAGASVRIISAPLVRSTNRREVFSAIERADRSRHEPEVVTSLPPVQGPGRPRTARLTPALARLPRP
jgi:putative FmdB family regulatory protein